MAEENNQALKNLLIWIAPGLAIIAFAISGWFFKGLNESIQELNTSVNSLKIEIRGIRYNERKLDDHEERIRVLENKVRLSDGE